MTLSCLAGGSALLVIFVLVERHGSHPLLPLRVVTHRVRAGAYLAIGVLSVTMFGVFLFLTFHLQQNLGYSPLRSGVAFMPLNLTILVVSGLTATRLLPRFGPRPLVPAGLLAAAAASFSLTRLDTGSGYADGVLPALVLAGIGAGLLYPTTFATGAQGVDRHDAGVASAMVNTAQQLGGSIGIAFLSTIFADAVAEALRGATDPARAVIDGYVQVFWWAAGISAVAAVITAGLIRVARDEVGADQEKQLVMH